MTSAGTEAGTGSRSGAGRPGNGPSTGTGPAIGRTDSGSGSATGRSGSGTGTGSGRGPAPPGVWPVRRRWLRAAAAVATVFIGAAAPAIGMTATAPPTPDPTPTPTPMPMPMPMRIITVGSDVTEIVFGLGFGDRVIAVDDTSSWPEAAAARPKVGYLRSLAAEGLLSLRPDLLVLGSGAGPEATIRQIEGAGVPVVRVAEGYSLDGTRGKIVAIAAALGASTAPATVALLADFDRERAALDAAMPALRREAEPRTTLLLAVGGTGSPQAAGRHTAGDAIVDLVGAKNVFTHPGYKAVSLEALAAAGPDAILVLSHGQGDGSDPVRDLAGNPLLKLTPAGRDGRILAVSSTGLLAFGPRTPRFALELARQLRQPPAR